MKRNIKIGMIVHGKKSRHGIANTWCGFRYRTTWHWSGYGQVPRGTVTHRDVDCMACIATEARYG